MHVLDDDPDAITCSEYRCSNWTYIIVIRMRRLFSRSCPSCGIWTSFARFLVSGGLILLWMTHYMIICLTCGKTTFMNCYRWRRKYVLCRHFAYIFFACLSANLLQRYIAVTSTMLQSQCTAMLVPTERVCAKTGDLVTDRPPQSAKEQTRIVWTELLNCSVSFQRISDSC